MNSKRASETPTAETVYLKKAVLLMKVSCEAVPVTKHQALKNREECVGEVLKKKD
jgi:hypothetical protein